jgi:hypothetical protein
VIAGVWWPFEPCDGEKTGFDSRRLHWLLLALSQACQSRAVNLAESLPHAPLSKNEGVPSVGPNGRAALRS